MQRPQRFSIETNNQETSQGDETLRYPPELLTGFIVGILLGLLPVIFISVLFQQPALAGFWKASAEPESPTFLIFWVGLGVVTAIMVTAGFRATTLLARRARVSISFRNTTVVPVTGKEKEEEKDNSKQV